MDRSNCYVLVPRYRQKSRWTTTRDNKTPLGKGVAVRNSCSMGCRPTSYYRRTTTPLCRIIWQLSCVATTNVLYRKGYRRIRQHGPRYPRFQRRVGLSRQFVWACPPMLKMAIPARTSRTRNRSFYANCGVHLAKVVQPRGGRLARTKLAFARQIRCQFVKEVVFNAVPVPSGVAPVASESMGRSSGIPPHCPP